MPRKSTAELAALKVVALDGKPPRLRPPPSLNEAERAVFIDLVAAAKSDHFVASDLPLLTRYCEAIVLGDRAAVELRQAAIVDGKVSPWISIQEKATKAVIMLSMRLRLSPQSRAANNPTRPVPRLSAYEMEALRNAED
jgi:phage terminase small subunit